MVIYLIVERFHILNLSKDYIAQHPWVYFIERFGNWRLLWRGVLILVMILLVPDYIYEFLKKANPQIASRQKDAFIWKLVRVLLLLLAIVVPTLFYFLNKKFDIIFALFWIIIVLIIWGVVEFTARRS
jgi:hypothetical protein